MFLLFLFAEAPLGQALTCFPEGANSLNMFCNLLPLHGFMRNGGDREVHMWIPKFIRKFFEDQEDEFRCAVCGKKFSSIPKPDGRCGNQIPIPPTEDNPEWTKVTCAGTVEQVTKKLAKKR